MLQPIRGNFFTTFKTVPASYQMKHYHTHDYNEIFFIIDGECSLYIKPQNPGRHESAQLYRLTSGSVAIIPAGTQHMTIYLSGVEHERSCLYFNNEQLNWIADELGTETADLLTSGIILQIPNRKISYIKDMLEKIRYEYNGVDSMSQSFMHAYFHTMILFLLRCHTYRENVIKKMDVANQQIQNIIEYIIKHYSENITLANTADFFHMSQSSLSKKFKAFTGQRFKEYLINVRTQAAAGALRDTDNSITEIAASCGFSDSNTFGDTFRRIFNMSPTEYRRCN